MPKIKRRSLKISEGKECPYLKTGNKNYMRHLNCYSGSEKTMENSEKTLRQIFLILEYYNQQLFYSSFFLKKWKVKRCNDLPGSNSKIYFSKVRVVLVTLGFHNKNYRLDGLYNINLLSHHSGG